MKRDESRRDETAKGRREEQRKGKETSEELRGEGKENS